MTFEKKLNKLYEQIAQQVSDMIPIEWNNFYFNGEVIGEEGGIFFFFVPEGENEQVVYSHYIPQMYDIDKRMYNKSLHEVFELTVKLQQIFINNNQEPWFSVTMTVNSTGELKVHFDYTDWKNSEFGPTARIKYFEYKYIKQKLITEKDQDLIERMEEYKTRN